MVVVALLFEDSSYVRVGWLDGMRDSTSDGKTVGGGETVGDEVGDLFDPFGSFGPGPFGWLDEMSVGDVVGGGANVFITKYGRFGYDSSL